MPLEFKWNAGALKEFQEAVFVEAQQMYELDIVPLAKRLSPVTPEGLAHNIELHRKRPGGTGDNRRSIDAEVTQNERGVKAELFTASGHGGYLEIGTSRMKAQPYLYPAFIKFIKSLGPRVRERVGKRRG